MRNLHNKKGFTLVEMIMVVAVMGIVLFVSVSTYNSIVANSNNKTCSTNIEAIKAAAVSYYSFHGQEPAPDLASLADSMADDTIPVCPYAKNGEAYEIYVQSNGSVKVVCPFANDGTNASLVRKHTPPEAEKYGTTPAGTKLG